MNALLRCRIFSNIVHGIERGAPSPGPVLRAILRRRHTSVKRFSSGRWRVDAQTGSMLRAGLLATISSAIHLQHDAHRPQRFLEPLKQGLVAQPFRTHPEQEPHADLVLVGLRTMLRNHLIVRGEERTEWPALDIWVALGANDDLIEETDI